MIQRVDKDYLISIVLPCRNEEEGLSASLKQIERCLADLPISYEIIVSDSSSDNSPHIAKRFNTTLVKHDKKGYGRAYREGFRNVRGEYIFCADPDGTYDFSEIPRFIAFLEKGYDLVIGNRFKGKIHKGSMPWHHQYIGNPALSGMFRMIFGGASYDVHCGMRAISREALNKLDLSTTGMEFASEMLIQAIDKQLKIKQLPINYHKRHGESKLRSYADGMRHIRCMLNSASLRLKRLPV